MSNLRNCYSVASGQSAQFKNVNLLVSGQKALVKIRIINIPAWMQEFDVKKMLTKIKPSAPMTLDFKELLTAACR